MVTEQRHAKLPAVDERLVAPEQGYEIVGGRVFAVSPAKEPHAIRHIRLAALLEAHAADGWLCAVDMLTRASELDDFAPDASVYPEARDPQTGGRQLERLAFEVVVSETLAHAGKKAASLVRRGVQRVVAIDVERSRALEWSDATASWQLLAADVAITDIAFARPLPIAALVSTTRTDDEVARALLAKNNRVLDDALAASHAQGLAEGHAEGRAEAIVEVLRARGVVVSTAEARRILAMRDRSTLARWLGLAATCASVAELFGDR